MAELGQVSSSLHNDYEKKIDVLAIPAAVASCCGVFVIRIRLDPGTPHRKTGLARSSMNLFVGVNTRQMKLSLELPPELYKREGISSGSAGRLNRLAPNPLVGHSCPYAVAEVAKTNMYSVG